MKKLINITILLVLVLSIIHPIHAQNTESFRARFALNGGLTFKTSRAPMDNNVYYRDYLESVNQGLSASANMQFFIKDILCIGLNYDYFKKHSAAYIPLYYGEGSPILDIDNTYTMDFLSFSLGLHIAEGRHHYLFQYLIGFMDYKENGNYSPYLTITAPNYSVGHCLGQGAMLNYDFLLNNHYALGIELTYFIGSIKKLNHQLDSSSKITSLSEPIRINRFSPKIGIRYFF